LFTRLSIDESRVGNGLDRHRIHRSRVGQDRFGLRLEFAAQLGMDCRRLDA